ncbi:serine hydrolase [Actinoplanes sp. NBRC 14428]|uniref:D-alanyl-D-alanine carboxypeptidase n=1 Tax=Pseudosporangium ferrugineum TaxID=439699 RepID=A0A2T0S8Z2_9ACTN|nr:serine hydrolase domain-containing protein [Pseudosporangium ferrugineum]PRY29890.1 D-alanyl-D-alanine carboxypeptidase [Pseudosporangium ferrugineum]BCJ50860.1 serine hydrolase [Actinoplanes sp. NBRC 14428]
MRISKTFLTVTVAVAAAASSVPVAQAASRTSAEASAHPAGLRAVLQQDADALLKYGAPGVLVELDTAHGDTKVRSGFGNVEKGTPVPWNAKFRIGSYTKTFVSATLLQLVGEGRLKLDDSVEKVLPGVVHGNGNDGRKITVRQLLQHTSGLTDYLTGMPQLFSEEGFQKARFDTVTSKQAVELAMTFKPQFAPGAEWDYSNTNYVLAGMIIERVTGHRWQDEVQRRIIAPLGLRDTSAPGTSPEIPRPHAVGYERFPGPDATEDDPKYGEPIDATRQNPSWGGAAGEIISTTDDGNRFLQALLSGKVLRPAELAEMTRTVPTNDGFRSNWPGARYGLGLMWVPNSCGGSWAHGGDIMGFQTRNGVTPDGTRSIIVSINTDSFKRAPGVPAPQGDITRTIIDHALCTVR